jgi:hypothetical protein
MTEGEHMVRILAALAVATTMLAGASSEASAWVCRAAGLGSGGWARSVNVVDAKMHHPVVPTRRLSMIPKSCKRFG